MLNDHMDYNLKDYGIRSDPDFDNSKLIQKAIDDCNEVGGGRVIMPSGSQLMAGHFNLKSNVNLHLESNSEIYANSDDSRYTKSAFRDNRGEGTIWIGGENLKNVLIDGNGTLNGNGIAFMGKELSTSFELKPVKDFDPRPHLLTLVGCKQVAIRDVSFKNSPYWTMHLVGCEDVVIEGVRILNSLKIRNSDGIDLDHSKKVNIRNCFIESGDDCICFKNRREYQEYGNCENISVSNCIMTSTSCALKIGSENVNTIRNIVVNNSKIQRSNRGIGIQNRDEGSVEDILFENLSIETRLFADEWWGKAEPIYLTSYRRGSGNDKDNNWRFATGQIEGKAGNIKNITFNNIDIVGENGIFIAGEPQLIKNISLNNIQMKIQKNSKYRGGFHDKRPCQVEGLVELKNHGIFLENTRDVTVENFTIHWAKDLPDYYEKGIKEINCENTRIKHFHEE